MSAVAIDWTHDLLLPRNNLCLLFFYFFLHKCVNLLLKLCKANIPFLSAPQPSVSVGLLNNQFPLLSIFRLLYPLLYLHYFQVCYNVIHPSQTRSSSPSSYKQSSFHHLLWHRSHFHSLCMSQPSYPSRFYEFHNILSVYGSIHFFIISNFPNIPLLDRPIDPPQYFPFEDP